MAPKELKELAGLHRRHARADEHVPRSVAQQVVEERWASDRVHLEEIRLLWAHRQRDDPRPPRLTSKRSRGSTKLYGFDQAGKVITARRWYDSDRVDFDWYRDGDDAVWFFHGYGVRVGRVWRDGDRVVSAGVYSHEGSWSVEHYHWSGDGFLSEIEIHASDAIAWERGERATRTEHLDVGTEGDEVTEIVDRDSGRVVFAQPTAGLDRKLRAAQTELAAAVTRAVDELNTESPVRAVALRYDEERPLPPDVEVLLVSEAKQLEPSEYVQPLNPEEWHASRVLSLPEALSGELARITAELSARDDEARGRQLLVEVARSLNHSRRNIWVFALELNGESLDAELAESLAESQLSEAREAGLLKSA